MAHEFCTVCGQTFAATRPGDAHRVGRHDVFTGPERRRCRTPDEMRAGGMWQDGVWHGEWRKDGVARRRPRAGALGAANPSGGPTTHAGPADASGGHARVAGGGS